MKRLLNIRGLFRSDTRRCNIYISDKKFSTSDNESSSGLQGEVSPVREGKIVIDDVCRILGNGPWGYAMEEALSSLDQTHQPELVKGVLKRLKDVNLGMNYFRWVEKKSNQVHSREAYDSLLMLMVRNKKFDYLEQILEEMSLAGCTLLNDTCVELVTTCISSQMLREAFNLIQTMRKFKYRPAFSAYTNLIGALAMVHEPDLALTLFHQMQEIGYEVNVHLFTTLVRVFARECRGDYALSICFGKVGKVDMAWKFFHEMKAQGIVPDDVTYTSMIGVLCKANRLDEAIDLFEKMELNRKVP